MSTAEVLDRVLERQGTGEQQRQRNAGRVAHWCEACRVSGSQHPWRPVGKPQQGLRPPSPGKLTNECQNTTCPAHLGRLLSLCVIWICRCMSNWIGDSSLPHNSNSLTGFWGDAAGPLVGTHAHEVMSVFGQLLAQHDDAAGGGGATPVQVRHPVRFLVRRFSMYSHVFL